MIYKNFIRVLNINLETQKIRIDEREDLVPYLGGVGVASKLLEENMRVDLPPTAPEQPIVFAIGALSTIFPVITKTVAMFISPLTGELGESYAGGRMAMTMFEAGFDAMVITGKSAQPIYLSISYNDVSFKDARVIWKTGMDSAGRIIRDNEQGQSGKRSIIRIGMAGENQVSYACVTVDRYRHFGRMGLGAMFGSKHLIALNIMGGQSIPIENFKEYFKVYREIFDKATEIGGPMAKYHDIGTPVNVTPLNAAGALPTLNMQSNKFEHAENVSGEAFAEKNLVRKLACVGCPVGCIHIGQVRRAFADHGHEYETISVGYDYELIFALGTFLGVKSKRHILELIEEVEVAGMDAMSTGVCLGWATEAYQKGLITLEQTLVPLEFGNNESYCKAIQYIAESKNEFYADLGKGVRYASEKYGGEEFAMHISGNEMPGYHTGYGSLVGVAVAARQSHLCNGGYSLDQAMKPDENGNLNIDADEIANALLKEEVERCMLNSLVICLFARKVYDRETILKAFASIGKHITDDDLTAIAKRIYATKLRIKKALGRDLRDINLPKRFFETPTMHGLLDETTAYEIIEKYREKTLELTAELADLSTESEAVST